MTIFKSFIVVVFFGSINCNALERKEVEKLSKDQLIEAITLNLPRLNENELQEAFLRLQTAVASRKCEVDPEKILKIESQIQKEEAMLKETRLSCERQSEEAYQRNIKSHKDIIKILKDKLRDLKLGKFSDTSQK